VLKYCPLGLTGSLISSSMLSIDDYSNVHYATCSVRK
jgi:hypothetical protein